VKTLTPAALVTLLLLKNARDNPDITAELRRWAGQLRAVLDRPGGPEEFTARQGRRHSHSLRAAWRRRGRQIV
jgi:hypothetical protein